MVILTLVFFLSWTSWHHWPYLVLSSSLAIGAASSMGVRQMVMPSHHSPTVHLVMVLLVTALLLYSLLAFVSLKDYF